MSKKGLGKMALGATVGAGLALLFAPKKGADLRGDIKKKIDAIIKEEMQNIREQVQNNQAPFNREIVEKYFADYLSQLTSQ